MQGLDHWSRREDELAFLVFDHKNSKRKKFKKLRLGPGIQGCTRLVDSCGGLVLFVEVSIRRHRFFVLNPYVHPQWQNLEKDKIPFFLPLPSKASSGNL